MVERLPTDVRGALGVERVGGLPVPVHLDVELDLLPFLLGLDGTLRGWRSGRQDRGEI